MPGGTLYAAPHGLEGMLKGEAVNLSAVSDVQWRRIAARARRRDWVDAPPTARRRRRARVRVSRQARHSPLVHHRRQRLGAYRTRPSRNRPPRGIRPERDQRPQDHRQRPDDDRPLPRLPQRGAIRGAGGAGRGTGRRGDARRGADYDNRGDGQGRRLARRRRRARQARRRGRAARDSRPRSPDGRGRFSVENGSRLRTIRVRRRRRIRKRARRGRGGYRRAGRGAVRGRFRTWVSRRACALSRRALVGASGRPRALGEAWDDTAFVHPSRVPSWTGARRRRRDAPPSKPRARG